MNILTFNFKSPILLTSLSGFLISCSGIVTSSELEAKEKLRAVNEKYIPSRSLPTEITENTPLNSLIMHAVMRSPEVESAYYSWIGTIENITVERSLPNPSLMFEADIQSTVMSLMPGLMVDFPGPGKLALKAEIAEEESNIKFRDFQAASLKAASDFKNAYYLLQGTQDAIRVTVDNLGLVRDLKGIVNSQYTASKASLQDVLRAEMEERELEVEVENLKDSLTSVITNYKASIGLPPEKNIPLPKNFINSEKAPPLNEIYEIAKMRNPTLRKMAAEIRRAENAVSLSRKSENPDFSLWVMTDVKPSTPMLRPRFIMTLPIWRDKIRAEIESAIAQKKAAEAQYASEELKLASDFAASAFMFRESNRDYSLLNEVLIPKAEDAFSVAQSGYVGGISSFIDFIEAERLLLKYQLAVIEARKNRELSLTNLSLTIAGIHPYNVFDADESGGKDEK
ncbi:MAG TPA: TolC family protein [Oligoflexia bacterium]|nr:TolC family protein [Oligoflexia bacterium]HMP49124.1 TolC family protein [Oligoflexia bacterium]